MPDNGFNIGGGYGFLDYYNTMLSLLMQGQGQNIARYGQMGTTPIVLDPNRNYYKEISDAYGVMKARGQEPRDRASWVQMAVSASGLPAEVVGWVYDKGASTYQQWGRPVNEGEFNNLLQTGAQQAIPSLDRLQQQQQQQQFDKLQQQQQQQFETTTGMDMLKLQSNLRGPENTFQYLNALNNAQGSPQLEYARRLAQGGQPMAAFQGWGPLQPATVGGLVGGTNGNAPAGAGTTALGVPGLPAPAQSAAVPTTATGLPQPVLGPGQGGVEPFPPRSTFTPGQGGVEPFPPRSTFTPGQGGVEQIPPRSALTTGSGATPTPTTQPNLPVPQLPAFVQPHQANVRQLAQWLPSQWKGWNSALEAMGAEPEDWLESVKRAAPKGTAATTTRWG